MRVRHCWILATAKVRQYLTFSVTRFSHRQSRLSHQWVRHCCTLFREKVRQCWTHIGMKVKQCWTIYTVKVSLTFTWGCFWLHLPDCGMWVQLTLTFLSVYVGFHTYTQCAWILLLHQIKVISFTCTVFCSLLSAGNRVRVLTSIEIVQYRQKLDVYTAH